MRKDVARVSISSKALKESPDGGQRRQKAKKPGVAGIALLWFVPFIGVQTKEQLNVLKDGGSTRSCQYRNERITEKANMRVDEKQVYSQTKLTAIAYVNEQYMSPRKKSRNSTG